MCVLAVVEPANSTSTHHHLFNVTHLFFSVLPFLLPSAALFYFLDQTSFAKECRRISSFNLFINLTIYVSDPNLI